MTDEAKRAHRLNVRLGQGAFAGILKGRFPWLGTDEEAIRCTDEVRRLEELYEELTEGKGPEPGRFESLGRELDAVVETDPERITENVNRIKAAVADQARSSAESAQEPEPVDRQTRADLISALNLAITADKHRVVIGSPKSTNPAILKRWEAIRDDLQAQELAQ